MNDRIVSFDRVKVLGYFLGWPFPVVHLRIKVSSNIIKCNWEQLDLSITSLVDNSDILLAAENKVDKDWINRLFFYIACFSEHFNIPFFKMGQVISLKESDNSTIYDVVIPYSDPRATIKSLEIACHYLNNFHANKVVPLLNDYFSADYENLKKELNPFSTQGVNVNRFIKAAISLKIPFTKLSNDIYIFGQGAYQHWLKSSFTNHTSAIGASIANNKHLTAQILKQLGYPGANNFFVNSAEQAIKIAEDIGYPVVIKPANLDRGIGVYAGLKNSLEVFSAFSSARKHSNMTLLEKHFSGQDYRLVVFNGKLIKAILRRPGGVCGDGKKDISQLVSEFNNHPTNKKRIIERGGEELLKLDDEALDLIQLSGYRVDSILPKGDFLALRRKSNISFGGLPESVLEQVHPDNKDLAINVSEALSLDLAGIDLIIEDITKSWKISGALICEVNAQPQIGAGTTPKIYEEILQDLIPSFGRIKSRFVITDDHKLIQNLSLSNISYSTSSGVWIDGVKVSADNFYSTSFESARQLIFNRRVKSVTCFMNFHDLNKYGFPIDQIDELIFDISNFNETVRVDFLDILKMSSNHANSLKIFGNNQILNEQINQEVKSKIFTENIENYLLNN